MDDAMADCIEFLDGTQYARLFVEKNRDNRLYSLHMVGGRDFPRRFNVRRL